MATRFHSCPMRFMWVLVVLLGMTAGGWAQSDRASVDGTWTVTVKGQGAHGDMTAELHLKQDGKTVTGKMVAHGTDRAVSGDFNDRTLSLTVASESDDQQTSLTAKLKEDGTLAGYVSGPMGDMQWTAVRAAAK